MKLKKHKNKNQQKVAVSQTKQKPVVLQEPQTKQKPVVLQEPQTKQEPVVLQEPILPQATLGENQYGEICFFPKSSPKYVSGSTPVLYKNKNNKWVREETTQWFLSQEQTRGNIQYQGKNIRGIFCNNLFFGIC